jgi:hypothetical protein
MTDLGEELESALRRAKDTRPGLDFELQSRTYRFHHRRRFACYCIQHSDVISLSHHPVPVMLVDLVLEP